MPEPKRPLKVFLCHAHADRDPAPQGDDMRALPAGTRLAQNGVNVWLDKEKPCGGRSRTILPGQDWESARELYAFVISQQSGCSP